MAEMHDLDRRTFIRDIGRGVLGISIGAAFLPACGRTDETTIPPAADTTTSVLATTPTTRAGRPDPTTASSATSRAGAGQAELDVRRVVLGSVSAYILVRGTEAAVVDTGTGGSTGAIEQALAEVGIGWANVGHVILTHRHPDHIGSLGAVASAAVQAVIGAGAADIEAMTSPRPIDALTDGHDVFGLHVVETPGHTPGHVAVFDAMSAVLVAGDAINGDGAGVGVVNGVGGPNPQFTPDMDGAIESARKLAALNPDTIFFGHGEPKVGGASAALQELVGGL